MNKVSVGGVELLAVENQQTLVAYLLNNGVLLTGKLIAINAEKIMIYQEDNEMKRLLEEAEYKYADGISVVCTIRSKYPKYSKIERIAGADLWERLMAELGECCLPVFLVGSSEDTLQATAMKLQEWQVKVVGTQNGYFAKEQEEEIIRRIKASGARFISVAMGSPKQEKFMQKAQQLYPDALYMGVGGTYDVFVGKVKRAPKCWQNLGLEWLFRILHQPTRWKRQLRLMKYAYFYLTKRL
ncbi:lipopolysaccharide N-acetylmannosaminouronosyltransferase [Glaesserella parasuis]|uniref:lipopolysaccharide N-acetylmannosaminouronosyltransferase n=1 Tax=Glaesserella parasuis TaxID=738 RepID=UPI0003AC397B|nr:lipopolysaccharide N-acetylmannosaminouronosyltransferase [Glaesserella parasuis]EQA05875.1 glycosyl transferase, WecB/TagA/CpsF family protein [Glaesserella parasuis 12939]MCT8556290.1 lipopolysaccharide N-acetylmannosaminouronosyltransferase [Glaesserella parasuis]MCT8760159.1 lipopolysaccharide N-acetylmannosaminouronosyltransferase [Glaesserella parasuis]MCT8766917.1 lipopolysaccharide N-acetylmannosaminouronosyltransferase [Glaesserella parasuis]MCT8780856.1 lipopolysaccharide N-acetyl